MGVACVGGGLVKCRVALDRGGYVPGESVLVTAFISNHSNVTIKRTKASLTEVCCTHISIISISVDKI